MGDLLSPNNVCGQNLLRIVSRGSAIIAELLRLSSNIPECFLPPDRIKDPEQLKYAPILFDYQYLRDADECEKKVNESQELLDIDQEFQENFEEILGRFFMLFQSVWKFQADFNKFIEDVQVGYYIQHSLESIVDETAGKQLLSEALYHYGMMMLFMEEKIPGVIRERLLIAHYRLTGGVGIENLDEIFKLWRNTGYAPNSEGKRPKNHPESLFARFPPPKDVVRLVIGHLQTDDVYLMNPAFPDPDHRSTRLANQAGMLYVILYFSPDTLHKQKGTMREVVDKYFNDNWVIATYMGQIVDLFVEWAPYAAAKAALDNVLNATQVKALAEANAKLAKKCERDLQNYLREGILQQEYILDNIKPLLHCMRNCNIALRWRLLHRKTRVEAFRKILLDPASPMQAHEIVALLLNTSQFEFLLKEVLQALLAEKDAAWTTGKDSVADRLTELSEYFTGEKALTRVKRDESLMQYFAQLSQQVRNLNLDEGNATSTGRTIKSLIAALDDVEQFESLDTNIQIKSFIAEIREIFLTMIRTVNIKNEVLHLMETISDLSYAWQILVDYIPIFHERISKDPGSVTFLRATFLKAASMLDVPLVRITAIDSPDAVSVAEYYSGELVEFVRIVLEIIPKSIFTILSQIVTIQTTQMQALPIRFEAKDLKEFAQLDTRFEVAKLTYRISTFTEGILLMERTLLGVIQVDPRHILEEGLRRELVRLVSIAMNKYLTFPEMSMKEINENMQRVARTLDGLKKSIEYLQDYIGIAGLKIFMQEFFRIVNYNIEQESNRFVKKKTLDSSSRYQSKAIPIPRLLTANAAVEGEEFGAMTFMGRVMAALLALTDPTRTIYASECAAWFEHPAPDVQAAARKKDSLVTVEVCGARTFQLLERSIGAIGLRGLDRLVAFRTVHALNAFVKFYSTQVHPFRTMLDQVGCLRMGVSLVAVVSYDAAVCRSAAPCSPSTRSLRTRRSCTSMPSRSSRTSSCRC